MMISVSTLPVAVQQDCGEIFCCDLLVSIRYSDLKISRMARLDWISQTRLAARSLGGDKNETMEARKKRLDKKCVLRMIKSLSIKHAVLCISDTWVLPGRQRCSSPSLPESLPIPYWRTQDCEPDNLLKRKMKKNKLQDAQADKMKAPRSWSLTSWQDCKIAWLRLKDFTFEKPTHPSKIVQNKRRYGEIRASSVDPTISKIN